MCFFIMFIWRYNMGRITIKCENCGKRFIDYESNHRRFCCMDCKNEYQSKVCDDHKIKKCIGCGKTFRPKENRTQFCGLNCYYNYIRENSYTKIARKCKWCRKEFYPNHHKKQFCSKECAYKWYSGYKSSEEQKKLQSEKTIRTLCNGLMKETLTTPHVAINELLKKKQVNYINEYNIKYYAVDIYLQESGLMIEIMGDYWHSNPTTKFKEPKNTTQIKTSNRDRRKHTYVHNQYGIEILYLWENDIKNEIEKCEKLIDLYIRNKGILEDYNSFNYSDEQGNLVLNQGIVRPLFMDN